MKRLVNFKEMEEEEKEIVDEDVIEEGGEGKVKLKVMVNQSINQRLYLTSNLLIAKLLISPKKISL